MQWGYFASNSFSRLRSILTALFWKFLHREKAKFDLKCLRTGHFSLALSGSLCIPECLQSIDLKILQGGSIKILDFWHFEHSNLTFQPIRLWMVVNFSWVINSYFKDELIWFYLFLCFHSCFGLYNVVSHFLISEEIFVICYVFLVTFVFIKAILSSFLPKSHI